MNGKRSVILYASFTFCAGQSGSSTPDSEKHFYMDLRDIVMHAGTEKGPITKTVCLKKIAWLYV